MSTDNQAGAASVAAPIEGSPPFKHRQLDRIDQPARPLGAKRTALLLRRRHASPPSDLVTARSAHLKGEVALTFQAGNVSFSLRATDTGLLMERTQMQPDGSRVVQTMVLTNAAMFGRWCACEPIRFDNPALFDHLRREGHDALRNQQ